MTKPSRFAAFAAALLAVAQPVAAAGTGVRVEPVQFSLSRPVAAASGASASMTLAASRQTAAEAAHEPARRGTSTTTIVIIVGVVLLAVLVAAAVAGATPRPGPPKGAFD